MNSKIGPLNPLEMGGIGNNISNEIFTECKEIVDLIEQKVEQILKKNKSHMIKLAKLLLKKETITYSEITKLLPKRLENSINF